MNLEALLSPSAAKALPQRSKERALSRLAMRQLWHAVFDPCPLLLKTASPDEWKLLEPFLEHAHARRLSMRWSLHGHLLLWLSSRGGVTAESARELLAAAASRWAVSDRTAAKGVLVRARAFPEFAVAGWKGRAPGEAHRAVLLRLEQADSPRESLEYALISERDYPAAPDWTPLPA